MVVSYNGNGIPSSSKFDNLAILVERLNGIQVAGSYRKAELYQRGLVTEELVQDPKIVAVDGHYFGGQVVHHFSESNDLNGRYPHTVELQPVSRFFHIDASTLLKSIGDAIRRGVPILEKGKVRIAHVYDLHESLPSNVDKRLREYLPLVDSVLYGVIKKYGQKILSTVDKSDLRSAGIEGLWQASQRYDPSRAEFKSYATRRIFGAMMDELRRNATVPRQTMRRIKEMNKAVRTLEGELFRTPEDGEIATHMGISVEELGKLKSQTMPPLSLSSVKNGKSEDVDYRKIELSDTRSLEFVLHIEVKELVRDVIFKLKPKERKVMLFYYWEDMRMHEIGEFLGVSESRIYRIHSDAIAKLRRYVKIKM